MLKECSLILVVDFRCFLKALCKHYEYFNVEPQLMQQQPISYLDNDVITTKLSSFRMWYFKANKQYLYSIEN